MGANPARKYEAFTLATEPGGTSPTTRQGAERIIGGEGALTRRLGARPI